MSFCFFVDIHLSMYLLSLRRFTHFDDNKLCKKFNQVSSSFLSVENRVTLVMMGYNAQRKENYKEIFDAYSNMPQFIEKIIFVWNNVDVDPPEVLIPNENTTVPIYSIRAATNSMNNRFRVYDHVATEGVLLVDDDIILHAVLIDCLIKTWLAYDQKVMVGPGPRWTRDQKYLTRPLKHGMLKIQQDLSGYSIIVGKIMLFHKSYLKHYSADESLVEWNEKRHCEDIAMNALISNISNSAPIALSIIEKDLLQEMTDSGGLSSTGSKKDWHRDRDECIRFMQEHFSPNVFKQRDKLIDCNCNTGYTNFE